MADKKGKKSATKKEPATRGGIKGYIVRYPDGKGYFVPDKTPPPPASYYDRKKRDPKGVPYD